VGWREQTGSGDKSKRLGLTLRPGFPTLAL
jgi:hypothetical protein